MTVLSSSSISGDKVVNRAGEDLGDIKDLMIDVNSGQVTYAVVEFGGFMGIGSKLFAVPLSVMQIDTNKHQFILDQSRERLQSAPGFDKDDWPDFADTTWGNAIHNYYATTSPHSGTPM